MLEANVIQPSVLTRLRAETLAEHDAIEAVLNLTNESISVEIYRQILERFYGYYRPAEASVRLNETLLEGRVDLEHRWKMSSLEYDLRALGITVPELLPVCQQLPRIDSAASAFGVLYVMEGATMGGQFISQHIRRVLGVTPDSGGRFFSCYGENTGKMWQSFRKSLDAFAKTQETQDQVVTAALDTFRTLRAWFLKTKPV